MGLVLALEIPIDNLTIYGYSKLVIRQMNDLYHIKKSSLTLYFQKTKDLAKLFWWLWVWHVKRGHNRQVDALASLVTSLNHLRDNYLTIHICERWVISPLSDINEDDTLTCTIDLQGPQELVQDNDEPKASNNDWHIFIIQHVLDRKKTCWSYQTCKDAMVSSTVYSIRQPII